MRHFAALPFILHRASDVIGKEIVSTAETIHGVLRLSGDNLVVQWRASRSTRRIGEEIRTDSEIDPVEEAVVPLAGLAAAEVRRSWWRGSAVLVLTASDLRAFERVAGQTGLALAHPAQLVLAIRRSDREAAEGFAAELEIALAERELGATEEKPRLPGH
jgi:hypothetical protein